MFQRRDMAWIRHEHGLDLPERFLGSPEPAQLPSGLEPGQLLVRESIDQRKELAHRLRMLSALCERERATQRCPEVAGFACQRGIEDRLSLVDLPQLEQFHAE